MGGRNLAWTVCVTVFIHTLSLVPAVISQDPEILQVTDNYGENDLVGAERSFQIFINKYGKEYSTTEEYMHQLRIFAKNLIRAAEHQVLDPTAVHGVTPFSDLSEKEFKRMYTALTNYTLL